MCVIRNELKIAHARILSNIFFNLLQVVLTGSWELKVQWEDNEESSITF